MATEQTNTWLEPQQLFANSGQEPAWLLTQREKALDHYQSVGLPGVRDEQWRYTNLREIKAKAFAVTEQSEADFDNASLTQLPKMDSPRLVFLDGHFSAAHSNISSLAEGVIFSNLSDALEHHTDILEAHFGSTLPQEQHGFTALNTAFCQDGYVLVLSKNTHLKEPLEVVFIASEQEHPEPKLSYIRNLLITESGSQVTLIERFVGNHASTYLTNSVSEIIAGDNSHIDHYRLLQESDDSFHFGGVFIQQAANSQIKNHNLSLTGLVTRNDIVSNLNAPGAHIEMNGLILGQGRQHFDNHTQVNHLVPHCTSDEHYKTILDGQSRSVFRGRIVVAEDAQQTNADQQNNNLLLSSDAEADTLPQLEIYADDVKCSHGATVGQLDPNSLFYLQSRGINYDAARALLTFAFANEVVERIKVDTVRAELTTLMNKQLLNANG